MVYILNKSNKAKKSNKFKGNLFKIKNKFNLI